MNSFTKHYLAEGNEVFPNSLVQDKVYHGSSAKFKEFSNKYIGNATGTVEGKGFYFTDDKSFAEMFIGKDGKLYEVYINITNPLSLTDKTITKSGLKRFIKKLDPTGDDYLSAYGDVGYEGYQVILNKTITELYRYNDNDADILHDILHGGGFEQEDFFDLVKSQFGFDGVMTKNGDDSADVYVVFNKNNIKIINIDESFKLMENEKVHSSVLDGIKKNGIRTTDVGGDLYLILYHGTSKANHKKILKSGMLKTNTYLTHDSNTARKYAGMTGRSPVVDTVVVKADGIVYDGSYFYTTRNLNFNGGMYS